MDDLVKQLAAQYDLAALRKESDGFVRYQDREQGRAIRLRHSKIQNDQVKAYERTLPKRIDQAARHIGKSKGVDFDKLLKAKDERSKRQVKTFQRLGFLDAQSDHTRRMALLHNREARELSDLSEIVKQRAHIAISPPKQKLLTDGRADAERQTIRPRH